MPKTALLLTLLTFQVAVYANLVTNEDLELGLLSVKKEVKDLTLHLETGFPNSHHAIDTITWQCHGVAEIIQTVINELKKEIVTRKGDRAFKQFSFELQEVHTSLQQIALSTDVNEVASIKSLLVANLELASETLEKIVHVTYVHYPDFRFKLKTILFDCSKGLRAVMTNVRMEDAGVELRMSPKELSLKIQGFTQSLLVDLETHHEVFHWYLEGTGGVLRKLKTVESVGDDELDVVFLRLTRKIKKIVSVIDQAGVDRDVKIIVSIYLTDIASLFGQLVHYIENGSQGENNDRYIEEVMYDYYHVLEKIFNRLHRDKNPALIDNQNKYVKKETKEFLGYENA